MWYFVSIFTYTINRSQLAQIFWPGGKPPVDGGAGRSTGALTCFVADALMAKSTVFFILFVGKKSFFLFQYFVVLLILEEIVLQLSYLIDQSLIDSQKRNWILVKLEKDLNRIILLKNNYWVPSCN